MKQFVRIFLALFITSSVGFAIVSCNGDKQKLADKEKAESLKSKHRRPIGFIHYDNEE